MFLFVGWLVFSFARLFVCLFVWERNGFAGKVNYSYIL